MAKHGQIRVLVANNYELLRMGLHASLLAPADLQVIGEAVSGRDAIRLCDQLRPDVAIIDLVLPDMSGIDAIRAIREAYPEIQVIALTSSPEAPGISKALQAGAVSLLSNYINATELANAIRGAYEGMPSIAPEAIQTLVHMANREPDPDYRLTPREREVLSLVAKGLSNREIALQLEVKLSTANFHVRNILAKLGVNNRTEAALLAQQFNLVA